MARQKKTVLKETENVSQSVEKKTRNLHFHGRQEKRNLSETVRYMALKIINSKQSFMRLALKGTREINWN